MRPLKPSKGKVFLKDLEIGQFFESGFCKGYLIAINKGSCSVYFTSYIKKVDPTEIRLGKILISPQTEVIKLDEVKNVKKTIH